MHGGPKVVLVDGPISVGKTTASERLAEILGPSTLYLTEPDDRIDLRTNRPTNPFLDRFYADRKRWAFTMQAYLLGKRLRFQEYAQAHVMSGAGDAVLDRSYYFDTSFAHLQLVRGDMERDEFEAYAQLYESMSARVLLPTVCVLLDAEPSVCNERILRRARTRPGRECERVIDEGYLRDLNEQIAATAEDLRASGVAIVRRDWNEDRDTPETREAALQEIAAEVRACEPRRKFLDHRRVL